MLSQNIVLTGKLNPVTGQMEYKQTPIGGASMFTPYEGHTTGLAASIYEPCSIVDCQHRANPLNVVEATLDVFGSPSVRVHLCDDHYKLFGGATTGEHEAVAEEEKPDIVVEEQV